jgi:hypoxanthine phosphoribosyltransferase
MRDMIAAFAIGVLSSIAAALTLKYIADKYATHISFRRTFKSIMTLNRKIQADGYLPDYIISVDRNGSIVGGILSGYLSLHPIIAAGTETVRQPDGSRRVKLSEPYSSCGGVLSGKRVLIVACFVDTGSSLETIYEYYASLPDGPAEIRTASLYTTTSPRFKPKYFIYEVGRDVKVSLSQIIPKMP